MMIDRVRKKNKESPNIMLNVKYKYDKKINTHTQK